MNLTEFDGLWLLLALLLPLLFVQYRLHYELQSVLFYITRHPGITLAIFALLMFPGLLLHEGSHWLMAKLLGVRTGKVSLLPEVISSNTIRMGYVEAERSFVGSEALIGLAPLIVGSLAVTFIGGRQLGLLTLWDAARQWDWGSLWQQLQTLGAQPDFWVWFYLMVSISSMMFPSASDWRAFPAVILFFLLLIGLAWFVGAGAWLWQTVAPPLNDLLRSLAMVFAMALVTQTVFVLPLWLLRNLLQPAESD